MNPFVIINPISSPLIHRTLDTKVVEWDINNRSHTIIVGILDADTGLFIQDTESTISVSSDCEYLSFISQRSGHQSEPVKKFEGLANLVPLQLILIADENYPYGDEVTLTVTYRNIETTVTEFDTIKKITTITKQSSFVMTTDELLPPGTPVITLANTISSALNVARPAEYAPGEQGGRHSIDLFAYVVDSDDLTNTSNIVQAEGAQPYMLICPENASWGEWERKRSIPIRNDAALPYGILSIRTDVGGDNPSEGVGTIKTTLTNNGNGKESKIHFNLGVVFKE